MSGRGVGDPGPAGQVAQADRGGAGFLDGLDGCGQERAAEIAVVVALVAPAIVLVTGWILARLAELLGLSVLDGWQPALCVALALMFTLTGVAHFTGRRAEMIAMVPPTLPASGGPPGHGHGTPRTGRSRWPAAPRTRPRR
ncbi:hypothetical protein ACFWAR_25425 [Streptomyces sp. NPDC059917]|uniref:hypothetical protein n=1 Tax=Streptomyces sp. NPDC059917 TaxID=3347002 RepID=UPI00364C8185